jgi:sulfite oxidase
MNNSILPARHGYPVRTIIPGIIGARSVKWLDTIVLSSRESQNFYHQHDYKVLPPEASSREKAEELGLWDQGRVPPMMDVAVNSVVAVPGTDETEIKRDREDGKVLIKGYAIPSGANGPVVSVYVSLDQGHTWHEARILDDGDENTTHPSNQGVKGRGKFSWVLWDARIKADPADNVSIWSKAVDYGGNTQEDLEGSWNLRGVGFNAVEGRRGIRIV